MHVQELIEKNYTRRLSVHLDGVKDEDKAEIAGMLRGLMCAIEGWGVISGLTNDVFSSEGSVILPFSTVENAHYFKNCVEYYFSDDILMGLKVKKRIHSQN